MQYTCHKAAEQFALSICIIAAEVFFFRNSRCTGACEELLLRTEHEPAHRPDGPRLLCVALQVFVNPQQHTLTAAGTDVAILGCVHSESRLAGGVCVCVYVCVYMCHSSDIFPLLQRG